MKSNISENRKNITVAALKHSGHNVDVLWDTAFRYENGTVRVKVRCNICNGIEYPFVSNISRGNYSCDTCLVNKYKAACSKLNFELIGKESVNSRTTVLVKCLTCGGQRRIECGKLVVGKSRCHSCTIEKYKDCLSKKNCTFVGIDKMTGKNSVIHYQNKFGDHFKTLIGYVTSGSFETSTSGNWASDHSVYLIALNVKEDNFIYKIGTASDPQKRAEKLKLNKDHQVFTLASFETRYEADKLESELHREFSDNRLCSHSVSKYTDGYVSRKRSDGKYHRVKDGITEWFSSEVYETLKVRYNLT